ncbi:MAG: TetR/AcrR family transcriptional regulator [Erysipelotrichaceae bacterium]
MMKYPSKKIQIFEAVFKLANKDADLRQVTVQEIATQAQIGKGTLYEYFKSKEEIVEESLIYFAKKEIQVFYEILEKDYPFELKIKSIMRQMTKNQTEDCSFNVIVTQMQHLKLSSSIIDFDHKKKEVVSFMMDYLDALIQCGIKESVIDDSKSLEYIRYCLFASFSTLTFSNIGKGVLGEKDEIETAIDYSYQMIKSTILK